jgi:hypothetical protein
MLPRTARVAAFPSSYVGTSRRATSCRCQRNNVSGLTGKLAHAGRRSERLKAARNARSALVSFGRACRRRIASSCRNTRPSSSFERRGRANKHTQREQVPNDEIHERPKQSALPRPRQERRTYRARRPGKPRMSLRTLRASRSVCLRPPADHRDDEHRRKNHQGVHLLRHRHPYVAARCFVTEE